MVDVRRERGSTRVVCMRSIRRMDRKMGAMSTKWFVLDGRRFVRYVGAKDRVGG